MAPEVAAIVAIDDDDSEDNDAELAGKAVVNGDGVDRPNVVLAPTVGGAPPAETHGSGATAVAAALEGVQLGVNGAPEMNGCSLACDGVHRRCGSICNKPCRK